MVDEDNNSHMLCPFSPPRSYVLDDAPAPPQPARAPLTRDMSGEARSFERSSSAQGSLQDSVFDEPDTPDPTPVVGVVGGENANEDGSGGFGGLREGSSGFSDDDDHHNTHSNLTPPVGEEHVGELDENMEDGGEINVTHIVGVETADAADADDHHHDNEDHDTEMEEDSPEGALVEDEEDDEDDEDSPASSLSDEYNHTDDEDDEENDEEDEEDENEHGSYLDLRHDRYTEVRGSPRYFLFPWLWGVETTPFFSFSFLLRHFFGGECPAQPKLASSRARIRATETSMTLLVGV